VADCATAYAARETHHMWQPPSAMTLPLKGKPGLRATRGRVSRIEKAPASNGAFPYAGTGRSHRENERGRLADAWALDKKLSATAEGSPPISRVDVKKPRRTPAPGLCLYKVSRVEGLTSTAKPYRNQVPGAVARPQPGNRADRSRHPWFVRSGRHFLWPTK
jgi:hypothetical protein